MPKSTALHTELDMLARSAPEEIERTRRLLRDNDLVAQLLEGYPGVAVILDRNRQIVAHNTKARELFLGVENKAVEGMRLGEALGCTHASELVGGCGTTRACGECGAAQAVAMARQTPGVYERDCRITTLLGGRSGALNLRVQSAPITVQGEVFTLVSFKDVAHEKRLQALERIFFHDVLNTAAAINSISALMDIEDDSEQMKELVGLLRTSSAQLIGEIHAQRDLLNAERGELAFVVEPTTTRHVVDAVYEMYKSHDLARDKILTFEPLDPDLELRTGPVFLIRCIGNLVKNALEASDAGDEVTLRCEEDGGGVTFHVENPAVMPESVQVQVFQRSFSTKSRTGRGLGTYSVRLLVEQYLQGRVWFRSEEGLGTVFSVHLPMSCQAR